MISSFFRSAGDSGVEAITGRYIAWIDGVGAWLIVTKPSITLGRASETVSPLIRSSPSEAKASEPEADIPVMANLSRRHAVIDRVHENYILTARSDTAIQDRPVADATVLPGDCEIRLGDSVRLAFSMPTPLSATARLTFTSDHRLRTSVDGMILMAETCVLGPSNDDHIRCPDWPGTVVLVQTPQGISAKSKQSLSINGRSGSGLEPVSGGEVVSGEVIRFRLEPLDQQNS